MRPVVLALSGIGKVAAATTATALIERFGVRRIAFERRVQHANVQPASHRLWVAGKQVIGGGRHLEAAPVKGHLLVLQREGLVLSR